MTPEQNEKLTNIADDAEKALDTAKPEAIKVEEKSDMTVLVTNTEEEKKPATEYAEKAPDTETAEAKEPEQLPAQTPYTDDEDEDDNKIPFANDGVNYTFYDERVTANGNHSGEDALPYASNDLLIVADGLGGSGSFSHKNMDDTLFDPKKLDEVFHFNGDKTTKNYAKYMFSEFYRPQTELLPGGESPYPTLPKLAPNEYKKASEEKITFYKNTKKSGYFGSHLVAVLVKKYFTPENIARYFDAARNAPETAPAELGKEFTEYIRSELKAIHESVGFNKDLPPTNQHIYLPTTLASTLINEPEGKDYIELIPLYAGDSRIYCFTEKNGFQQVTAEDESAQTALMTNKITLSDDNFYINCTYVRIPKPCAVFSASDGLFDMMGENIDFEYYMLTIMNSATSFENFGEILAKSYFRMARPDDSCSIALHLSDMSFDDAKRIAEKKLDELIATYRDDKEHGVKYIFEENYTDGFRSVEDHLNTMFRRACEDVKTLEFFKKKAKETYADSREEIENIKKKVESERLEKESRIAAKRKEIGEVYKSYWKFDDSLPKLRNELIEKLNALKDKKYELIDSVGDDVRNINSEILASVGALSTLADKFPDALSKLKESESETLSKDYDIKVREITDEINNELALMRKEIKKLFETKKNRILPFLKSDSELTRLNKEINALNESITPQINAKIDALIGASLAAAEENTTDFNRCLDELIAQEEISDSLKLIPEGKRADAELIIRLKGEYDAARSDLRTFIAENADSMENIINHCIANHSHELLMLYAEEKPEFLSSYIASESKLSSVLKSYPQWAQRNDAISNEERLKDIVVNYYKRQKLYAQYDKTYYAIITPEN